MLLKFEPLSGRSVISDNSGQIPKVAKYKKIFANTDSGEIREITDLDSKKYRRNVYFNLFNTSYWQPYLKKEISILAIVVNQSAYSTITKFINTISRKFKRKGINILGYIWARDIGEVKFEKHFHLIMAVSRVEKKLFKELFFKKKDSDYEVQFVNKTKGIISYVKRKELYGLEKERSYGRSRKFKQINMC